MYNVLIAEGNTIESHLLINCIFEEIQDIRLCNIASTGKETLHMIKNQLVDIILLDLKLADNINGLDIIKFISDNSLTKYEHSIIVFSGEPDLLNKITNNPYIFSYTMKSNGFDMLIKDIKNLLNEKEYIKNKGMVVDKIKHQKSINNIKCNITQAYIRMFYNCPEKYLEQYLNLYIGLKKLK